MANTWTLGTLTFAIDTSTNVAGLVALKGSAVSYLDTITGSGSPTLTVESDLRCKAVSGCILSVASGITLLVDAGATATTLAMLRARTRDLLAETSADLYDDAEIDTELNEGAIALLAGLDALPRILTPISTVASTAVYDAPTDLERWSELWWSLTPERLMPLSIQDYLRMDYTYRTTAATPEHFMYNAPDAVTGLPTFQLVPPPSTTSASVLTGTYYALPVTMSDSVGPNWHRPFHYAVCYYAAASLLPKDNRAEAAADKMNRFVQEQGRYQMWLRHQRPDGIDIVPPSRHHTGGFPSVHGHLVTP
jgi:hypothetical protein